MIKRHQQSDDEQRPEITLTVYDRGSFGILELVLPSLTVTVRLLARHVKVLLVLDSALRADEHLAAAFRGLRSNEQIANAYAHTQGDQFAYDEFAYVPGPQAMAAYRAQIHKLIREASPPGFRAPPLFETIRSVGVRLIDRIEVIDLSASLPERLLAEINGLPPTQQSRA